MSNEINRYCYAVRCRRLIQERVEYLVNVLERVRNKSLDETLCIELQRQREIDRLLERPYIAL